jgi:hypothetical protein
MAVSAKKFNPPIPTRRNKMFDCPAKRRTGLSPRRMIRHYPAMTDAAASARTCGSCTLCCKLLGVTELEKPLNVWCVHCKPGGGCKIYDARPQSCRDFICGWLADDSLPDALRPDRAKVVLGVNPTATRVTATCDPAQPTAWRKAPVYPQLKAWATQFWGRGRLVTVRVGEILWLITPTRDVELGQIPMHADISVVDHPGGKLEVKVTV